MTDLNSNSASIANLYKNIGFYRASPVRIAQSALDFLDEVLNGAVDLVDPTNPFLLSLEMSCVLTAVSVQESLINLRRANPGLAETDQDIYRHLTDQEYIGRFALPGSADFVFVFELDPLLGALVFDPVENCYKGIIPRDSFIVVDTYTFTFEYPVVIRRFPNGVIQVTYDTTIAAPLSRPTNNIISSLTRTDRETGRKTLHFQLPLKQMAIQTLPGSSQRDSIFKRTLQFNDQFVHARVFQRTTADGEWVEMYTTHSDQVFDRSRLTAVLQVLTGQLTVTIPFIYNTTGLLTGEVRIDLYTSKGRIDVNLGSYTLSDFKCSFFSIDEKRDTNEYTNIWSEVSYFPGSTDILSGGRNAISFEVLKQKTIDYAFGNPNVPITNAQVDSVGEFNGFTIVRNADALTHRYFLGTRPIPDIAVQDTVTNTQKLLSKANIGMIRFSADILQLEASDNVVNNNGRLTLLAGTTFTLDNGKASLTEVREVRAIQSLSIPQLVSTVNTGHLVYTPFYYVFDLDGQLLNIRPYDLDHPDAANLNFVLQNNTLMLAVNTGQYAIAKTDKGYRLTIVTTSGSNYKSLTDNQVAVQLRLTNRDGSLYGTINGVLQATDPDTKERIYAFDIETSYDVDESHALHVINAYNQDGLVANFYVPLDTIGDILYSTSSLTTGYVSDATDALLNKSKLPAGSAGNSHDTLELFFGQYLAHLWARSRTFATGLNYQTATADIPARYDRDVYEINPTTGSMLFFDGQTNPSYHKQHDMGDPMFDDTGQPLYKYRVGDVIHDEAGNPIVIDALSSKNEFDVLVIDGKFLFVTDQNYLTYRDRVIQLLTSWITEDLLGVQARLMERTEIFFYPQAALGVTQIVINGDQNVYVDAEQSLTAYIFVDAAVINDASVQSTIAESVGRYLDNNISRLKFTVNQLESELKVLLGANIYGISLTGLGGAADYKSMNITDQHNRLCIKRKLVANTDNSLTIQPDLNIIFVRH